ncbi:hypothetical protein B7R21_11680 [Subtercola boreus]|uniref:Uncharacterized protein n=1 Tax=Subtercola boreus TaxID=120213 RepID=A0A3E0VSY0_9MICO|nr:hypothetical protein [Subtercola boreus]RFA11987.1 hypothetical protein B7R21_11680 [Subtercola boreus]
MVLAFAGGSDQPPSGAQSAFLVLVAAVFQGGSIWAFAKKDRAEPEAVKIALRRLLKISTRINSARLMAERGNDEVAARAKADTLGELSTALSFIEEDLVESVEDWSNLHPAVLRAIEEGRND